MQKMKKRRGKVIVGDYMQKQYQHEDGILVYFYIPDDKGVDEELPIICISRKTKKRFLSLDICMGEGLLDNIEHIYQHSKNQLRTTSDVTSDDDYYR